MARSNRRDRDDDEFDDDRPARRRDRDDDDDFDDSRRHSRPQTAKKGMNVVGLIALIASIVGLPLAAFPCTLFIGMPLAGIGMVLGIIGLFTGKTTGRGLAIGGLIVGLLGLLAGGGWIVAGYAIKSEGEKKIQEFDRANQAAQERAQEQAKKDEEKRQKEEKDLREGKAVIVTAEQLYKDFDSNPLSADTKYKGKVLEVSGAFVKLHRDFGKFAVELDTEGGTGTVRCEFSKEFQVQLEKLKPEQKVTFRGKCVGAGTKKDEVKLENCLIVSR